MPSGIERMKREDPERYVRGMAGAPGFDLEAYLAEYVDDDGERARLRELGSGSQNREAAA